MSYRVVLVVVSLEVGGEHIGAVTVTMGHCGPGAGEGGREVGRLEVHCEVTGR